MNRGGEAGACGRSNRERSVTWTGANEVVNLIIQHECYCVFLTRLEETCDVEADAAGAI